VNKCSNAKIMELTDISGNANITLVTVEESSVCFRKVSISSLSRESIYSCSKRDEIEELGQIDLIEVI
jgi:hypothetical protein